MKMNRTTSSVALIFIVIFFFALALYRGASLRGREAFSTENLIETSLFFLIIVPLYIIWKKRSEKNKKKDRDKKA